MPVHDLNREGIFAFSSAPNLLAVARDQRDRLVPGRKRSARIPNGPREHLVRLTRRDLRQIGAEPPAATLDPVTTRAVGAEESFTVRDVPRRFLGLCRADAAQIGDDRPELRVWRRTRGHDAPRHARPDRLEHTIVDAFGLPRPPKIR